MGSAENGVDLKISAAATGNVVVNGTLMVNGVDILALVAAQASRIEALENAATAASPITISDCGSVTIASDFMLAQGAAITRSCSSISGLIITGALGNGVENATLLAEAFRSLVTVTGTLEISNNNVLADLSQAFPRLTTVGGLYVHNNDALADLGQAFPALETVTGRLDIDYNDVLANLDQAFPALATVGAGITISHNDGLADLGQAFPMLATVGSRLIVQNNDVLADLGQAFPALATVGDNLMIQYNDVLADLSQAFPALATVGADLQIRQNRQLTTIGTSFGSLQTVVGYLRWFANGRPESGPQSTPDTRAFCASASAVLCPTTPNYGTAYGAADSTDNCCSAYCRTTTAC